MSANFTIRFDLKMIKEVVRARYTKLIEKGSEGIKDEQKKEMVEQVNRLGLFIAAILLVILPIFHFWLIPNLLITFGILTYFLLNVAAVLLNHQQHYRSAASLLFIVQCAAVLYFGRLLGSVLQLQFMVFFLIAINYQVFRQQASRVAGMITSILVLAALQFSYSIYPPVIPLERGYTTHIVEFIAIMDVVVVLLITNPYVRSRDEKFELKKANRVIKMFVAQITHEIRSPLNAIGLISRLMKKEIKKDPQFKSLEPYADMLIVGSNTTRTIVNNVLDMAQIEAGKVEQGFEQTFFVKPFFTKLIDVSKIIAQSRNMRIRLLIDQMPSLITSDPLKLNQIMNNLLSNAIKYGKKDSTITVTVSKHDDQSWTIEVKNPATPIAAERLNTLFDPFVTGKSNFTEGTGLGLYIVRNKVLSMNGAINADNTTDQYVVFTITLPLLVGKSKDVEPEEEEEELMDLCNTRVLIAEDEPINARALSLCLEDMGCHIDIAKNGKELISKALTTAPDIIMMDYHMPLMNGEIAMRHLKDDPLLKNIPVIVTTGDIFTESLDRLLEAGADGYIAKPIEAKPLQRVLSKHLYQKNDELQE